MLSKSLIQFSVEGRGYVPFLLFDLRPNYDGGNEDNGDLRLQGDAVIINISSADVEAETPILWPPDAKS